MPLTKVEQDICLFVIRRLLNQGEPTRRQAMLKEFRGSLSDALRKLVDRAVLKTVDQTYNSETCLPRAIAFYYCGQPELLEFAQKSTETVLKILLVLYERGLDKDLLEQSQLSPADVETEAHNLGLNIDQPMVRLGLYFADELSVLTPLRRDEKQVFPVSFGISEHIYEYEEKKISSPWDLMMERGRANVENDPYGRSLDRIDIFNQPRNASDLAKKEKLIADVSGYLTQKRGIALLVIDLDHFKAVNDTKGHQEGDACLDRVVRVIGEVLGRKGILYRWGGDEFAVALPDFSTEEAHASAERIRAAVELAKPGDDLPVTTSIGVCGNDRMGGSAEDLLAAADKAMYVSKNQGKNRVTSWSALVESNEADAQKPKGRTGKATEKKGNSGVQPYTSVEEVGRPLIIPLRYGTAPKSAGKHMMGYHGLVVANHGEPAYDVSVLTSEIQIGTSKLQLEGIRPTLTKADGDAFFRAEILESPGHAIMGNGLFDEMRRHHVAEIIVELIYKDAENRWYKTVGKIERDVMAPGGLLARYIQRVPAKQPDERPGLEIVFGGDSKPYFENQPTTVLPGGSVYDRRYRVGVQNTTGTIVSAARVVLENCEPSVRDGIHLGHALKVTSSQGASEASVSPSDVPTQFFDVVYDETLEGKLRGDAFGLCYAAPVRLSAIPRGTYVLTLRVEGNGMQSRKKFKIFQDPTSQMLTMREI